MWRTKLTYESILVALLAVGFVFCGYVYAQDKELSMPSKSMGQVSSVTATVAEIDYDSRHAVLKMPDGTTRPVTVSEEAYNFDQVKVGDLVDITYSESIAISLEKDSGGAPTVTHSGGMERAPKGQKPEGVAYKTTDVRAKVVDINYETRTVDLLGPNGNIIPVAVDKGVQHFENIKKGDEVLAKYTEAVAISVRPADKTKE